MKRTLSLSAVNYLWSSARLSRTDATMITEIHQARVKKIVADLFWHSLDLVISTFFARRILSMLIKSIKIILQRREKELQLPVLSSAFLALDDVAFSVEKTNVCWWTSMRLPCRLLEDLPEDKQDVSSASNRPLIRSIAIILLALHRGNIDKNKTVSTSDRNQPNFWLSHEVIHLSRQFDVRQEEDLINQTRSHYEPRRDDDNHLRRDLSSIPAYPLSISNRNIRIRFGTQAVYLRMLFRRSWWLFAGIPICRQHQSLAQMWQPYL